MSSNTNRERRLVIASRTARIVAAAVALLVTAALLCGCGEARGKPPTSATGAGDLDHDRQLRKQVSQTMAKAGRLGETLAMEEMLASTPGDDDNKLAALEGAIRYRLPGADVLAITRETLARQSGKERIKLAAFLSSLLKELWPSETVERVCQLAGAAMRRSGDRWRQLKECQISIEILHKAGVPIEESVNQVADALSKGLSADEIEAEMPVPTPG
jgi:hypothetical protein